MVNDKRAESILGQIGAFLEFRQLITPGLIRFISAIYMIVWLLAVIAAILIDIENKGRVILILLLAPFAFRVLLENVLVRYLIYEQLRDISATLQGMNNEAGDTVE